jgi:hypothetical protein
MKRGAPLRRSPMRRRPRTTKYSRRPRDFAFMQWVKLQLCAVEEEWPVRDERPTPCTPIVEADHAGARGLSQKASDDTCIPLCTGHHRERTDHTGTFKHVTKEQAREWRRSRDSSDADDVPRSSRRGHRVKDCEWCGLVPATTRVIATDACQSCADATPKVRVQRALLRWREGTTKR